MSFQKLFIALFFAFTLTNCYGQEASKNKCAILKSGKFLYLDAEDPTAYIVMNGDKQVEYSGRNEYTIESDINWISDCTYLMKMTKISIPNFPFQPGDIMRVDINKIKGDIIYYTSTVKGQSWRGRFKRIVN